MVDNRSYKIYLVLESSWEYSEPVRAFTKKSKAEALAKKLDTPKRSQVFHEVKRIDLVTHDGSHALHADLVKDKGR